MCTYLVKGGKTATGVNPSGTSAKDNDAVEIPASVGEPPPPTAPGRVDPGGALPCSVKATLGTNSAKLSIPTANAAPVGKFTPSS